jgi:hypothetical protein
MKQYRVPILETYVQVRNVFLYAKTQQQAMKLAKEAITTKEYGSKPKHKFVMKVGSFTEVQDQKTLVMDPIIIAEPITEKILLDPTTKYCNWTHAQFIKSLLEELGSVEAVNNHLKTL